MHTMFVLLSYYNTWCSINRGIAILLLDLKLSSSFESFDKYVQVKSAGI